MSNNSSTEQGWLTPTDENPVYGEALDRILSRWVRGITGLPDKLVRPRWQPKPPPLPPPETTWCAFGVIDIIADDNPAFVGQTEEDTALWRHEIVVCMASFYGHDSQYTIARFREGITLNQNNSELNASDLSLISYSQITAFPEFINNQWVRRFDITVRLRRKVIRRYNIKSLTDAKVTLTGE